MGAHEATAEPRLTMLPTLRELCAAIAGCALLATLFLGHAIFSGRYLSAFSLLYGFQPWVAHQPVGGPEPTNGQLFDSPLAFEPWLFYNASRLHEGSLPLWNPGNYLGAPQLANIQTGLFSPLNWPFYLWPDGTMLVLAPWLRFFLAALGIYLLARAVLRVGPLAASLAAITFAYGAQMVVWSLWPITGVLIFLPWQWLATARLVERPTTRHVALVSTVTGMTFLAGHPESIYNVALTSGLFLLFYAWWRSTQETNETWRSRLRFVAPRLALWAGGSALGAMLASVVLLPFAEYVLNSAALATRSGDRFDSGLELNQAWTLISPRLFGSPVHQTWWGNWNYNEVNAFTGVLPLILAPCAFLARVRLHRALAFLLALTFGLAVVLVYQAPVLYDVLLVLPLMSHGLTHRFLFLMHFSLALLAALGFEAVWRRLSDERRKLAAVLGATLLFLLLVGIAVPWLFGHSYFGLPRDAALPQAVWSQSLFRALVLLLVAGAVLAGAFALYRLRPRLAFASLALLPLILWADLWQAHGDYLPTVAPKDYFPPTAVTNYLRGQPGPFRSVGPQHTLLANTNLKYGLADIRGYDAIEPLPYRELVSRFEPKIAATPGGWQHLWEARPSSLWNMLNVRYFLAPPNRDPNYGVDLLQEEGSDQPVGEIYGATTAGQTFVAQGENLARIEVLGATYEKELEGRLIFHLKTSPDASEDLVTQELDASKLPNNSYWAITFPAIPNAKGRSFYFYFEAPEAQTGQATTLWFSSKDVYDGGSFVRNGAPTEGDLIFRALSETGVGDDGPWFEKVVDGGNTATSIYLNTRALQRAWLVHEVEVITDKVARLDRLAGPDFDPASTAVLNAPLPGGLSSVSSAGQAATDLVTIDRYEPENVQVSTESGAPGLLVLSDLAYPGWRAEVDGREAEIVVANHALRAVYVPEGRHTVSFIYDPLTFKLGAVASLVSLIAVLCLALWPVSRRVARGTLTKLG